MIYERLEQLMMPDVREFMIEADNVANVIDRHSLSNALLILSQVNYALIPVLTTKSQFVGLLSMPMIIKSVMTVEAIELQRLDEMRVEEVMLQNPVRVTLDVSLSELLHVLIDHSFVCVVDDQDRFLGIVTRKKLLQRLTHLLHETSNPKELQRLIQLLSEDEA